MSTDKGSKKGENAIVRSSAAEYLTCIAASGSGGVEAVYADEDIWLSQKMMSTLYDVETNTINYHLKKVFSDCELGERAVIRNSRITAADGKKGERKRVKRGGACADQRTQNTSRLALNGSVIFPGIGRQGDSSTPHP